MTATDAASLEQFGYRQELKRSLGLFDLVVYGVVFIDIIAPFSVFGIVFNLSHGMVPLVYIVGFIAMLFTGLSYATMSRAFPTAGSVYAYAGRGIGKSAGFLAGWAVLLDYILMPGLVYVISAAAIQSVVPGVPRAAWIVLIIGFNTAINLLGIETTMRMNRVMFAVQITALALLVIIASIALFNGVAGAHLSSAPFFKPGEVTPNLIFSALSVAALSFLGFDAISTLAEESRGGAAAVGRATLLSLIIASAFFVLQTYLASLFVLDRSAFAPGRDTDVAFYNVAALIGGSWFQVTMVSLRVLVTVVGVALAAQVATARLLYSMARDGKLPRVLAHVHPERKVPDRGILLVAVVNLIVGVALANQLDLLVSMVNFGALFGFLLLHLSVIIHFVWRQKTRAWNKHLLVPLIGFAIIAYVLVNMALPAKIAGSAWLSVGIVALIGLKLSGRRARLQA